jgi:type I restriction enzyme M protein
MADSQQPTLFAEEEIAEKSIGSDTVSGNSRGKRQKKVKEPLTSKQQLSSIIKSVRDDLRKDAGLSGDTDRLPQLTWLLFLKSFNDFEEAYREMLGESYVPVIEAPYCWRDWADVENKADRKTGDELLEFVNNELIPYLARLSGPDERDIRTIVGTIFQGTPNRIRSGYILRSVIDKISAINFTLSDDAHAVSHFYETMLKEMRDAAGDSGEFYTPRPVVRFIINRLKPKLGERIMDPACGTAGFLVEAYEQLKGEVRTPDQRRLLEDSLIGIEKKPMPYLLGVMNMRLHGIEAPHLSERNALAVNVRQIKESERVDVIATNPPFGGAEEQGILSNFPDGFRTAETAILFFQYVMAMLKRPGGRCGIVLPNGFLFGNGVAAVVKRQLLTRFNLHTIVRLPNGTFAPYTNIPTNLLFFEACEHNAALEGEETCTKEVWYYELPLPKGRSNYSKTKPLQYEEFAECIAWWDNRIENEQAWKVSVEQLLANDCNLDVKNPNSKRDFEYLPPEQLAKSIIDKERRVLEIMEKIERMLMEREA